MPIAQDCSVSGSVHRAAPQFAARPSPVPARPENRDATFVAMQQGFRGSGGLVRGDALAASRGDGQCGGYINLARRLVAGDLFSFHWHDSIWVPLFQLEADRIALRDAPHQVLGELRGVFDGWDLAGWYLRCNTWLAQQRPLDLLDSDLPAVLAAARADRFAINR